MPRRELDFYETPAHYIGALFDEVNIFGHVYEPCSGDGAIADALKKHSSVRRVTTNDINEMRDADYHLDSSAEMPVIATVDWIITNPPFSDELPILENMMSFSKSLAFLARLSFLEPTEDREYFLSTNPPSQIITLPRHSFRPNDKGETQTDSVTCAWLVWYADRQPRLPKFYSRGRSKAAAILRGLSE